MLDAVPANNTRQHSPDRVSGLCRRRRAGTADVFRCLEGHGHLQAPFRCNLHACWLMMEHSNKCCCLELHLVDQAALHMLLLLCMLASMALPLTATDWQIASSIAHGA